MKVQLCKYMNVAVTYPKSQPHPSTLNLKWKKKCRGNVRCGQKKKNNITVCRRGGEREKKLRSEKKRGAEQKDKRE